MPLLWNYLDTRNSGANIMELSRWLETVVPILWNYLDTRKIYVKNLDTCVLVCTVHKFRINNCVRYTRKLAEKHKTKIFWGKQKIIDLF